MDLTLVGKTIGTMTEGLRGHRPQEEVRILPIIIYDVVLDITDFGEVIVTEIAIGMEVIIMIANLR